MPPGYSSIFKDINIPPLMPDEDKNFGGFLVFENKQHFRTYVTILSHFEGCKELALNGIKPSIHRVLG